MPTGYTADLLDGKDSPDDFILKSIRAMGVAIMQRDEDISKPVRRRKVEDYYRTRVTDAIADLEAFQSKTEDSLKKQWRERISEMAKAKAKSQVKYELESYRIKAARKKIESYDFPAELQGWRDFMLDQLKISEPYEPGDYFNVPPYEQWKQKRLEELQNQLRWAEEDLTRQEEIVKGNNEWLDLVEKLLDITIE